MDLTRRQIQLASKALPAVAPIAKTFMNDRMQMRALERQKEAEMEVVRAKNEYGQSTMPMRTPEPEERVVEQSDDAFEQSIDEMIAAEDCELCGQLLEGIKSLEAENRPVALSEYGRFQQSVEDTDDVDAIRDELQNLPVLQRVLEREFNMEASE
jgi:hypothetical protein